MTRDAITFRHMLDAIEKIESYIAVDRETFFTMSLPVCQQGRLRIIAAITERSVIQNILRHLKLAVDPPPLAPAQQGALV